MGIFNGCLLACDIDGTLLKNNQIARRNVERIRFFSEQGGRFSLSTGRTVGAVGTVLQQLSDYIAPSVVANGCMIYDYRNAKVLYALTLPAADHLLARLVLEKFPDVGFEVHVGQDVYVFHPNKETEDHEYYENMPALVEDFDFVDTLCWNKVLYVSENNTAFDAMRDFLATQKSNSCFLNTMANFDNKSRHYFEQIPQGVSKATALSRLCEILNVKPGCFFAIGDYYNDLEMLNACDVSAVPANAPDDLKAAADFVGCRVEDGAVADFIDHLSDRLSARTAAPGQH